jgi:hypothetical protein
VADSDVDFLRAQLRERGYLSQGIERWFAQDPWSSRAFWLELATVAGKAAVLIALFAVLPVMTVMLFRNHPLTAGETLLMTLVYAVTFLVPAFVFFIVVALVLRLRPAVVIDTPRALLAISFAAAAVFTLPLILWWYRFDALPSTAELIAGLVLIAGFFLVVTVVASAAFLSFSIYELRRVPAIHQKPRGVPMTIAAAILIALLFLPAYAGQDRQAPPPIQVVTTPVMRHLALIAVDGLTFDIFRARRDLAGEFAYATPVAPPPGGSTTERWASAGTGVPTTVHGVRAIEGIRLAGGRHLVQTLSRDDLALRDIAPILRLARREPLPPTVRRRDYVWEIFAGRGLPAASINWWTTAGVHAGALDSVDQATVFGAATASNVPPAEAALKIDATAARRFVSALDLDAPQFATVYLPALDVILNRLGVDQSTQLAASTRALDGVRAAVDEARRRRFDVILIGLPGDRLSGQGVLASTIPLAPHAHSAYDLAPTLCALMGFPPSAEMPGTALTAAPPRIATYGARASAAAAAKVDEEYYRELKSLGYIR